MKKLLIIAFLVLVAAGLIVALAYASGSTTTVKETVPGPVVTKTAPVPAPGPTVTKPVPGPTVTRKVPGPTVTRTKTVVKRKTVTRTVVVPGPAVTKTVLVPGPAVTVRVTEARSTVSGSGRRYPCWDR